VRVARCSIAEIGAMSIAPAQRAIERGRHAAHERHVAVQLCQPVVQRRTLRSR
jgi:hypothetical protein